VMPPKKLKQKWKAKSHMGENRRFHKKGGKMRGTRNVFPCTWTFVHVPPRQGVPVHSPKNPRFAHDIVAGLDHVVVGSCRSALDGFERRATRHVRCNAKESSTDQVLSKGVADLEKVMLVSEKIDR
jgi:hypothetical protein